MEEHPTELNLTIRNNLPPIEKKLDAFVETYRNGMLRPQS